MKTKILCFGKLKEKALLGLQDQYLVRLRSLLEVSVTEIDSSKYSKLPENELKKKECQLLLEKIEESDLLVLLDENGKELSSLDFATSLTKWQRSGKKNLVFALGGAFGWASAAHDRADFVLALSKMTFTYQFARVALIEQVYRAISINKGLPYHK